MLVAADNLLVGDTHEFVFFHCDTIDGGVFNGISDFTRLDALKILFHDFDILF